MSRFARRSATCETVTLNSSRKDRSTLRFWFFRQIGKKWVEFDVRHVAGAAGVESLPESMTADELFATTTDNGVCLEDLLQRDLQRAADWCFKVYPDGALAQKVAV